MPAKDSNSSRCVSELDVLKDILRKGVARRLSLHLKENKQHMLDALAGERLADSLGDKDHDELIEWAGEFIEGRIELLR